MKHKGQRDIPDFASKRGLPAARPDQQAIAGGPPPKPAARQPQVVKPQATSAKSGRRGQ